MAGIYLDHAATSPLRAQARAAMAEAWESTGANASSLHAFGREALRFVDDAREAVAERLGGQFSEVVFTATGTEAASLALAGCALGHDGRRRRVLVSAAEHHCVLNCAPLLERLGFRSEAVPVDRQARVRLDALEDALGDDVLLVALMHANNEFGTVQPVAEASELAHRHGALLFSDAVQTFAAQDWTVGVLGADLVSLSAHKFGGPLGVGALWVRAGVKVEPVIAGGGQERERRAGTENWPALAGLSAAVRAADPVRESRRKAALRAAFLQALLDLSPVEPQLSVPELAGGGRASSPIPDWHGACLPGHLHLRFPGVSAESLLIALDRRGVAAGSGAACSSGALEPSHVMLAAGFTEREAREGVRFTFGPDLGEGQARQAAERVSEAVAQVCGA